MSGFRIEVDVKALVHRNWRHLPWKYRWLWLIPGERKKIETLVVNRMQAMEIRDGS